MTHRCIKCDQRFPTSGKMVKHMRESHSSFVEDAQMKIDRSEESSFEAKKAVQSVNTAAQCPECKMDCRTRKKLVRHMETEHKEAETETEPEVKIIRLEKESKDKLLDEIEKEQLQDRTLHAQKTKVVNNLIHAVASKDGESEVVLPETKKTIQVSATSIKLSKYRCFWCDMAFRKRGKLMDHIDLFHKMSKEQTEVEAEMIHISVVENDAKKAAVPAAPTKEKKTKEHQTNVKKSGSKHSSKKKQKVPQTVRQSSVYKNSVNLECPETPNNNVCNFILAGSLTEISRVQMKLLSETNEPSNLCIFFNRKEDNPLPPVLSIEPPKPQTPEEPTMCMSTLYHSSFTELLTMPEFFHSSSNGLRLAPTTPLQVQPPMLPGPSSLHTGMNSAFHAYQQQQMNLAQDQYPFYRSPPQRRPMRIIDEYQQPARGFSLALTRNLPAVDSPLDLTLPKYRWN